MHIFYREILAEWVHQFAKKKVNFSALSTQKRATCSADYGQYKLFIFGPYMYMYICLYTQMNQPV